MNTTQEFGISVEEWEKLKGHVTKKIKEYDEEKINDIVFLWMEEARKQFNPAIGKSLRKFMYTYGNGGEMYLGKAITKWNERNGYIRVPFKNNGILDECYQQDTQKKRKNKKWVKVESFFTEITKVNDDGDIEDPDPTDPTESVIDKLIRAEDGRSDEDRERELDKIDLKFTFYMGKLHQYMIELEKQKEYEKLYCVRALLGMGKQQDIKKLKGQKSKNSTFLRDKVLNDLAILLKLEQIQVKRMLSYIKKSWKEEEVTDEFDNTKTRKIRANVYAEALKLDKTFQPHLFL